VRLRIWAEGLFKYDRTTVRTCCRVVRGGSRLGTVQRQGNIPRRGRRWRFWRSASRSSVGVFVEVIVS